MDACMEALCFVGKTLPQKMIMFIGNGGDGKSMRTLLRNNVFGGQHRVISPEAFQVAEEFRKQGCHFAFAACMTIQECNAGVALVEDVWKKCVSGEELASNYN